MIIFESMSPSPTMIDNDVTRSTENVTNGPMYKQTYLPNLRSLSNESVNFVSLSSNGIPTIYGWYDLMEGEMPNQFGFNMISSMYNDLDDIPSYFKQQGYYNLYVSPSSLEFDGKDKYLLRGNENARKIPDHVKKLPR